MSWFSGDATDLLPTEPAEQARRMVDLMGGIEAVLTEAKRYLRDGDAQFAAELARLALRAAPEDQDARLVKAAALRARGYGELNPIARSWYLTGALELESAFDPGQVLAGALAGLSADRTAGEVLTSWRYLLDAEAAGTTGVTVVFEVADTDEQWTIELCNGILDIRPGADADADATVRADTAAIGALSTPGADGADLDLIGDRAVLTRLLALLDREPVGFAMHQR